MRTLSQCLLMLLCLLPLPSPAQNLQTLSQSFWTWRAETQPFTDDDIPRLERSRTFHADWSAAAIAHSRDLCAGFEQQWAALKPADNAAIADQVDYRLLGSAIARVRWELDIVQAWKRNPYFYIDQTVGSVYILLLPPPPFEAERQGQIVARMQAVPQIVAQAKTNLTDMRAPFATLAISALDDLPAQMDKMVAALTPVLDADHHRRLTEAAATAVQALNDYRQWLRAKLSSLPSETAIGRDNYIFFLRNVALMPFTPEQLLATSQAEWSRTVAFEAYEQNRNRAVPPVPLFSNVEAQVTREQADESKVRDFLERNNILSVPAWLQHYRNLPLPAYVAPFRALGVTDDLTGPSRLHQNGTSYLQTPGDDLGFFARATAHDPRPILVHEGVPGHYFQLCLSWKNDDPIRRHYHDSGANEGIGFYAEEMMLQAGFFDDSPHTRETIYSFMRLRALRVEVDVKLALGQFTLEQAADYLNKTVPMDRTTALEEAAMFASTPGQAISYQIGKSQIMALLADARRAQANKFSLRTFHDFVWTNGNVPLSLQRWQMLGDASAVPDPVSISGNR